MRSISLAALVATLVVSGCVTIQRPQVNFNANYGEPILYADAMPKIERYLQSYLKDPMSAVYECGLPKKSWLSQIGARVPVKYGFGVMCTINAKNSFGGYVGNKEFEFLFQGQTLARASSYEEFGVVIIYDN